MNRKLFWVVLFVFLNAYSETYRIDVIKSDNLSVENELFSAFKLQFTNDSLEKIYQEFQVEEQAYNQKLENRMFFHALLGDKVIGYISCNIISEHHVEISQWAVDPKFFDVSIVKDLLFAVVAKIPKVYTLHMHCPSNMIELIEFLQNLGFGSLEKGADSLVATLEFKGTSKCKLCDLLYGNIWSDEDLEDEKNPVIDVEQTELVVSEPIGYN